MTILAAIFFDRVIMMCGVMFIFDCVWGVCSGKCLRT